ncbi:MAG: ATP-binding protein, partial [Proteobacteria bacterium]
MAGRMAARRCERYDAGVAMGLAAEDDTYLDPEARVPVVLRHLALGRSVCLVGPQGVGKTRLMVQCAAVLDDLVRVEALPGSTLDAFVVQIAESLGCALPPAAPVSERWRRVEAHLSQRRGILFLDALERLPAEVEPLLLRWLEARPGGYALASRRALAVGARAAVVEVSCLDSVRSGLPWAP